MKMIDALFQLRGMGAAVCRTADAAGRLNLSCGHASKLLSRLAESGHIMRLARGLWVIGKKTDAPALPELLTSPFPSYVSLQSALYYHGLISQMPSVTYAVSLSRTRRFKTPLGTVSVHHVAPAFFFGFETPSGAGAKMATPEKALVDFLYLGPSKTGLFRALPELELSRQFSVARARAMIRRIRSAKRRTMVQKRFALLLGLKTTRVV